MNNEKKITINVFGRTDVGVVREHNEDNFLVADLSKKNRNIKPEVRNHTLGDQGSLFVVCDGMGGAAAGEVASKIGIDAVYEMMQEFDVPENDEELARNLNNSIIKTSRRIWTAAKADRRQRGMGTTITAAVLIGPRLLIGQVGDSRAYILREKNLVQVSKDQSLVQQLIDAKQLTEEEARNFERNNIILQAMGTTEEIKPDITWVPLRRGDVLLLCSDGLSGLITDDEISEILLSTKEPIDACRQLTDLACKNGGTDNITVIISEFGGEDLLEPQGRDDVLKYRQFRYSDAPETTARHPVSKLLPEKKENEPTVAPPSRKVKVKSQADKKPEDQKTSSRGIFLIPAVLVVAIVIFAVYLLKGDKKEFEGRSGDNTQPPSNIIKALQVDSDPKDKEIIREKVIHKDKSSKSVIDEPKLTPTADEAITGKSPDTLKEYKSASYKKTHDKKVPEKEMPEKKTAKAPEPDMKPEINVDEIKKPEKKPEKKLKKKEKPVKKDITKPKKLDDNPF